MKKFIVVAMILALAISMVPMASAQDDSLIESVCLVTDLGRVNDGTFNQFAYDGMVQAVEEFELDSTFIETQAETDYENNIDTCVQEGFDAIVTVGFLIEDATRAAAEANPEVYFIGVDQAGGPMENFVGIQYREDQGGFLVGAMAAMVTQSNNVAGVYGIEIPAVKKFRNGFEQGVAFVAMINGVEIEADGVYIDDFLAPDRGASAAEQFIGDGADVIFGAGGPTGSGGITQAAQQGVYVIGVDQDEYLSTFGEGETPGAEFIFTSAIKRVDVGVYDMIAALVGGGADWLGGGNYILNIQNGGIGFAPVHEADVDPAVYEAAAAIEQAFIDGTIDTGVDGASGDLVTPMSELFETFDLADMGMDSE